MEASTPTAARRHPTPFVHHHRAVSVRRRLRVRWPRSRLESTLFSPHSLHCDPRNCLSSPRRAAVQPILRGSESAHSRVRFPGVLRISHFSFQALIHDRQSLITWRAPLSKRAGLVKGRTVNAEELIEELAKAGRMRRAAISLIDIPIVSPISGVYGFGIGGS